MNTTLKEANTNNVETVAWTVLTALDMEANDMSRVVESCSNEKSMYSWKNSIVACDGDDVISCIICYEGDRYEPLRQYT